MFRVTHFFVRVEWDTDTSTTTGCLYKKSDSKFFRSERTRRPLSALLAFLLLFLLVNNMWVRVINQSNTKPTGALHHPILLTCLQAIFSDGRLRQAKYRREGLFFLWTLCLQNENETLYNPHSGSHSWRGTYTWRWKGWGNSTKK